MSIGAALNQILRRPVFPLLDPSDTAPIRGELIGADHLGDVARELANCCSTGFCPSNQPLLQRLADNRRRLTDVHRQLADAAQNQEPISTDAEWLLDNYYVI